VTPGTRQAGAYDPFLTTERPGGRPETKPRFRVLLHKRHLAKWEELVRRVGSQNAQQFWDHVSNRADQPPLLGTCTPLKGKHNAGRDGWSRRYHYEITGAGRVDYEFHHEYAGGAVGDKHAVVRIIGIDWSSH
jgi:hypothetical protein